MGAADRSARRLPARGAGHPQREDVDLHRRRERVGAGSVRVGVTGVRRVLDNAADRALATRHAEAWYVATVLATAAASWALLTIARALTATKETP